MVKFLKWSSAKLFAVLVGMPLLLLLLMAFFVPRMNDLDVLIFLAIAYQVYQLVFLLWVYSVTTKLSVTLEEKVRPNLAKFKMVCKLTLIMELALTFMTSWMVYAAGGNHPEQTLNLLTYLFGPLNVIVLGGLLYSIWSASQVVYRLEKQNNFTSVKFGTDLILMILFPVGVWFIQPRINRLASLDVLYR
jgi:hypothetical protein